MLVRNVCPLHTEALYTYPFSLQISNAVDRFICKQFEASDVYPGHHGDGLAGINCGYEHCREVQGQIYLATADRAGHVGGCPYDVLNVGKAFRAWQLVGDICGAMQMPTFFTSRIVVVSGGASWASEVVALMRPAAPADDSVARKRRRLWVDCIACLSLRAPPIP